MNMNEQALVIEDCASVWSGQDFVKTKLLLSHPPLQYLYSTPGYKDPRGWREIYSPLKIQFRTN